MNKSNEHKTRISKKWSQFHQSLMLYLKSHNLYKTDFFLIFFFRTFWLDGEFWDTLHNLPKKIAFTKKVCLLILCLLILWKIKKNTHIVAIAFWNCSKAISWKSWWFVWVKIDLAVSSWFRGFFLNYHFMGINEHPKLL